jgi:hypothetical protein
MRRRLFLIASLTAARAAMADTRQELVDLFAAMATALSDGNPSVFLRAIDLSLPEYGRFAANVRALTAQNDLSSSIAIVTQEGDDDAQSVELEWLLEIRGRDQSHIYLRRQSVVKCRLERRKKLWRIVALDPAGFFSPPGPQPEK